MAQCDFCAHSCELALGQLGRCAVRKNLQGQVVSLYPFLFLPPRVDPIEKKPLYHFLPGTGTLSLGAPGCSFDCQYCQNWSLIIPESFSSLAMEKLEPENALRFCHSWEVPSISFTYSEPTVWQDSMIPIAKRVREAGIRTIMVTNGFFSSHSRERLLQHIDAFNVDLKGSAHFYKSLCKAKRKPVLDGLEAISRKGRHLEVTTLLVSDEFDAKNLVELGSLLRETGVKVWHLSRYHPSRNLKRLPTDRTLMQEFLHIAQNYVDHVYLGNVSNELNQLKCSNCHLSFNRGLEHCPHCGRPPYGVWS